jgi:hypothetical protein
MVLVLVGLIHKENENFHWFCRRLYTQSEHDLVLRVLAQWLHSDGMRLLRAAKDDKSRELLRRTVRSEAASLVAEIEKLTVGKPISIRTAEAIKAAISSAKELSSAL